MFHAGFVTFHNSQQKHNETTVEPPQPHSLGKEGFVCQQCVQIPSGFINSISPSVITCCFMLSLNNQQPAHHTWS